MEMDLTKKTKIKHLSKEAIEDICYYAIDWCCFKFGEHCIPSDITTFVEGKHKDKWRAHYNWNGEIIVYKKHHKNVKELIRTVIHEFIHTTQDYKTYYKYEKKYGYNNNPYEISANEMARLHLNPCLEYSIKKVLKSGLELSKAA